MEHPLASAGFKFYETEKDANLARILRDRSIFSRTLKIDVADSKQDILRRIAGALEFPADYIPNINWDSFEEAIRDLEWLEWSGIVIVLVGCKRAWQREYRTMSTLLEVFSCAHRQWQAEGKFFFLAMVD